MKNLAIYIHWPFCERKCPYCDFNSYVQTHINDETWLKAYKSALRESFLHTQERRISSLYFGGGTPSLMNPKIIEGIINEIAKLHTFSLNTEITLEVNPTTFETSRFLAFKNIGINRLSIGVQSFDDKSLAFLGRWHSADEAQKTLAFAYKHFERFSFDLIYARPQQNLQQWEVELKEALRWTKGHLSLYQLTIEPATLFGRRKQQTLDEDKAAAMYLKTFEWMKHAQMPAYEISNFAQEGQESQHNLNYCRGGDWIGIGPGAHGRFNKGGKRIATQDALYPEGWLKKVQKNGHARLSFKEISLEGQKVETIMTAFRTRFGFASSLLSEQQKEKLPPLKEAGLIIEDNGHIKATKEGWLVINSLLTYLI